MSVIARDHPSLGVAGVALAGTAGAVFVRVGLAQLLGPGAVTVGLLFVVSLSVLAGCCGFRVGRPSLRSLGIGVGGGLVLVGLPLLSRGVHGFPLAASMAPVGPAFAVWAGVVALVGIAEEVVFRGVLYDAFTEAWGELPAVCLGALAFGLLHVPFYGWGALLVDVAAGLWLGALRVTTRGVAAPATAHVLADWSTWWLR